MRTKVFQRRRLPSSPLTVWWHHLTKDYGLRRSRLLLRLNLRNYLILIVRDNGSIDGFREEAFERVNQRRQSV